MRIIIATGIYPPEVGGPAYYAQGLAEALRRQGHNVPVVTYGVLKKLPSGIRHLAYLLRLAPHLWRADAVIALDTFSVALPAALACSLFRVPLVIRTGGDFLWEAYTDRTDDALPLPYFYEQHRPFTRHERIVFSLTRWVVWRARIIIFGTAMQRDLWVKAYGIDSDKTHVVGNAVEGQLPAEKPSRQNFLWHVRPNAIKNGARVHAAFARAQAQYPEIVLEEGVIPHAQLLERMRSCYAVILPSLTEISPNYILEALRFRKPFIMDKHSGLAEWLGAYGMLVDPLDEVDIARAIAELATEDGYTRACEKVARFNTARTYGDIAEDFLQIIKRL